MRTGFRLILLWVCWITTGAVASASPREPSSLARLQNELDTALGRRDLEDAIRICGDLVARKSESSSPQELLVYLDELAQRFYATETPLGTRQAETLFKKALSLPLEGREESDPRWLGVMVGLADLYFEQGRFEESLSLDRRALDSRMRYFASDHREIAIAERHVGVSLTRLAYLREAQSHLERSVQIAERLDPGDARETAYSLKELAENLRLQNRYADARPILERAVDLAVTNLGAADPDLVELLISLSGIYRDLNLFAESQWRHRQAWDLFERSSVKSGFLRLALLNNEAEIRRFQGDAAGAEKFYREAIALSSDVFPAGHPRRALFMNQLAELLLERKRYREAEPLLREALAVRIQAFGPDHPELADTYMQLGRLYASSERRSSAVEAFEKAIAIRERQLGKTHPDVAIALVGLAEALEPGEGRRAPLDRAVAILRATPAEPRTLARALSLRSRLSGPGQVKDLTESLQIIERLRPEAGGAEETRSRFLSQYVEDYNRMVDLALDANDVTRAFDFSERRRSRTLLDQMSSARVDLRSGIATEDRARFSERENALASRLGECRERLSLLRRGNARREDITALEEELRSTEDQFASLYEEMKNASRLWRGQGALAGGGTIGLGEFQQRVVAPGSVALIFVIGTETSHLLTVPPPGETATSYRLEVSAVDAKTLGITPGPLTTAKLAGILAPPFETPNASLPEGLIADLASPPALPSRSLRLPAELHALFHVLIPQAVWSQLLRFHEAIVMPDGLLFQFPLEPLVVENPDGGPLGARYWLDVGPSIRYASSATLLANLEERPQSDRRLEVTALTVSNPRYQVDSQGEDDRDPLRALPATVDESEAIRVAFGDARVKVLQGPDATETSVRNAMERATFIHLATHGFVDGSRGALFASLALAAPREIRTTEGDGRLQLFEVYGLRLDAELAVLSACSTRSGRVVPGEGVFALSRGFLAAGAKRVIASLWQVEDQSTATLVAALFREIAATGGALSSRPRYAELLVAAKRSLRQQERWSAPFYWAPFVLDGAR